MSNPNTQPSPDSITCLIKKDIDDLLSDDNALVGKRVLHAANKEPIECKELSRFVLIHDKKHGIQSIWRISITTEPDNNHVTRVETGVENEFVGTYVVDNDKNALVLVHLGETGTVLPVYKSETEHMERVDNTERLQQFHNRFKECTPIDFNSEQSMSAEQAQTYINMGAVALENNGN